MAKPTTGVVTNITATALLTAEGRPLAPGESCRVDLDLNDPCIKAGLLQTKEPK